MGLSILRRNNFQNEPAKFGLDSDDDNSEKKKEGRELSNSTEEEKRLNTQPVGSRGSVSSQTSVDPFIILL